MHTKPHQNSSLPIGSWGLITELVVRSNLYKMPFLKAIASAQNGQNATWGGILYCLQVLVITGKAHKGNLCKHGTGEQFQKADI